MSTHRTLDTLLLWDPQNHLGRSSPPALDQMLRLPCWDNSRFPSRTVPECLPHGSPFPWTGLCCPGELLHLEPPCGSTLQGRAATPHAGPAAGGRSSEAGGSPGCLCLWLNRSQRESSRTPEPHGLPQAGVRVPGDDEREVTWAAEELLVTIPCLHLSEVLEAEGASKVKLDWRRRESHSMGSLT